jgi:hypothetical protein
VLRIKIIGVTMILDMALEQTNNHAMITIYNSLSLRASNSQLAKVFSMHGVKGYVGKLATVHLQWL